MNKTCKILIIGDSWANTIRKGGISGISEKNPFTKALNRHGFPRFDTVGGKTVWAGMRADDFEKDKNQRLLAAELQAYTELTCAHITVGGNDFLHESVGNGLLLKPDSVILDYLEQICNRIENLIRVIKTQSPSIHILFSGYDYVDIIKTGKVIGFNTGNMTFESFNFWFEKLNDGILHRLKEISDCCFVNNMGGFHRFAGVSSQTPLYRTPIIDQCYKPDGIHPNNLGNRIILDHCFDTLYSENLS
jgi:lysophospholipase L1-like esterase